MVAHSKTELSGHVDEQNHLGLLKLLCAPLDEAVTITRTEENGGWEIIYVNESFTRLTGYTAKDAIGASPGFLQGPKTERSVIQSLERSLLNDLPFRGRAVNYRKDGQPFRMDWEVVSFHDDQGNKRFYMAVQREAK